MKKVANKIILNKVIKILFYSLIYAIGLQLFLQPANLLTIGLAGVGQVVSGVLGIKYGIVYIIINIPGIIIGLRYIGKKFTFYSLLNIITVSFVTIFIPVISISEDTVVNAIFGGILLGYSVGKLLEMGASSGGTDFFAMYLLKYKNQDFYKVNLIINTLVVVLGVIYFAVYFGMKKGVELGLYTMISLYVRNTILDQTFTNTHVLTLFIIGDNIEKVSQYINNNLKRGTTIINNVEGGYTHKKKRMIMVTLNQFEYSLFLEHIYDICPNIFINIIDTKKVEGNYKKSKQQEK
ncbi:MAG: YitT family protein [Mycoplasmatales bacterium]